jgi:hypothetical protein
MVDPEAIRAGAEAVRAGAAVYGALAERAARQRASAEAKIRHRAEIRRELSTYLNPKLREDWHPEMIVIDAARLDEYPDMDERFRFRTLSPWFKVEAEKVRENELEVALAWTTVKIRRGIAREARKDGETVLLTGLVPFDSIIAFDTEGYGPDPYPTLFCHFDQKYGAYSDMPLYRHDGRRRIEDARMARRRPLRRLPGDLRLHWKVKRHHRRFDREIAAERVRLEDPDI